VTNHSAQPGFFTRKIAVARQPFPTGMVSSDAAAVNVPRNDNPIIAIRLFKWRIRCFDSSCDFVEPSRRNMMTEYAAAREDRCGPGRSCRGAGRLFHRPIFQRDSAGNSHAEYVDPTLRKIEQMRIEQRADNILDDDNEPDPFRQAITPEQE
jgi:hypothetical protein